MAMRFDCPCCGKKIRVRDELAGKRVKCPFCNCQLYVPSKEGEAARRDVEGELAGRSLAHYRILELVGRGGMGTVYTAKNLNTGEIVALKVFPYRLIEEKPIVGQRFAQEARLSTSIRHPNVLTVYFAGRLTVSPEEDFYIIEMEYADGGTLRDLLASEGKLDFKRATEIVRDAAKGLSAAHKNGIVHRDVKPGNILITKDGTIKVGDFGLAKLQYGEDEFTLPGFVVGTPYYMSPEQGLGRETDARSDIYSLGVTYFELVTGRKPFEADDSLSVLRQHVHDEVPSPCELNPECPESVCNVIMKMMAKSPDDRYQSCAELIEDLERVLAGEEVLAFQPERMFEVNDADIFRTVARFTVSGGRLSEEARAMLFRKAADLGLSESEAAKIIGEEQRKSEEQRLEEAIETAAPSVPTQIEVRTLSRLGGMLAQVVRMVIVLLLSAAAVYAGVKIYRAFQRASLERAAAARREEMLHRAEMLLQRGLALERSGNWSEATETIRRSLAIYPTDRAKKHLAALQKAVAAENHIGKKEWDKAEELYRELRGALPAEPVSRRLVFVRDMREYERAYREAVESEKRGELARAEELFAEAARLAMRLHIKTDADERFQSVRALRGKIAKTLERYERLFSICEKRRKYYAAFALAEYLMGKEESSGVEDYLRTRLARIRDYMSSHPAEFPRRSTEEKTTYYIIRTNDGKEIRAHRVEKMSGGVRAEFVTEGRTITFSIPSSNLKSVEKKEIPAAELNKQEAENLFGKAVKDDRTRRQFLALEAIGELLWNFPEEEIARSEERQRSVSRRVSGRATTISEIIERSLSFSENMCPTCLGVGSLTCPDCKGTGNISARCPQCDGRGRIGICKYCRGTGLKQTMCRVCRGTGYKRCARCKGKGCNLCGFTGKIVCTACDGTGRVPTKLPCPACKGRGKLSNGETCPICKGKGHPICTKCDGTGKNLCPMCKGTGRILVKCRTCNGRGKITCPYCHGKGKR